MFDLGWQEFILIAIITVIVVGPKDLPRVVRSVSQWVRKARSMAREFQSSLEEVAREAELEDVRREVQSISKDGIGKSLEKQFDPDGSVRNTVEEARKSANTDEIEADLKAIDSEAKSGMSKTATPAAPPPATPDPAIESAEDYAAKMVKPAAETETSAPKPAKPAATKAAQEASPPKAAAKKAPKAAASGTSAPAKVKKSRSKSDSAASGQG